MNPSLMSGCLASELADFPFTQPVDMSAVPLQQVTKALVGFEKLSNIFVLYPEAGMEPGEKPMGNPEEDALLFYMTNHAATLVQQRVQPLQPLGELAAPLRTYKANLVVRSFRMFYYMLLICTRESRHDHSDKSGSKYQAFASKYPQSIRKFHKEIQGSGSTAAAQALRDEPPECTLGEYTSFLTDCFFQGSYSSGFGGKAWGKVAEVLRDFSIGKLSAEMLMDTAFTLCHNNGPIFNKGMLFSQYGQDIYKILDVQRSGQIPQLVASKGVSITPRVQSTWKMLQSVLGDEFTGEVDWVKVESLGSLKKYPQEIAKMKNKPSTTFIKPINKVSKDDMTATFEEDDDEDGDPITSASESYGTLQVYPGQYVQKFKAAR